MKIIQVISSLGNGGAERLVIDLANELSKSNEVIIATYRELDNSMFYVNDVSSKVRLFSFGKKKGLSFLLSFKIFLFIRKEKPMVVNSHLASTFPYLILSILFFNKIKFFHTIHSVPEKEEPRILLRKIRKFLISSKKWNAIAISDEIAKSFKNLYRVPVAFIIYNGRAELKKSKLFQEVSDEIASYKQNNETVVFLSVGSITTVKNHRLLIQVFNKLAIKEVNAILIVIGDDYGNGLFQEYNLIKSSNTFFIGSKNNVVDYLFNSNVFCLSSMYEGFPIAILEALSIGLPVICTAVGGVLDLIIDNVNGFLSKIDEDEYLQAILKCLSLSDEKHSVMRKNNEELFLEKYSIETTAKNYLFAYSSDCKN